LDKLLWKPGCQLTPPEQEPNELREVLDRPRWILDGNYTASLPQRLQVADTVVVIDFHRLRCMAGALKRLLKFRCRTRPDMGAGCPERLDFAFLKWIWDYPNKERKTLLSHVRNFGPHTHVIYLRKPAEVERFLSLARWREEENKDTRSGGDKER